MTQFPTSPPTLVALDKYNKLWATERCCLLWEINPDKVAEKIYWNIQLQADVEIHVIENKKWLDLYGQKGLYLTKRKSADREIIRICDGCWYSYNEWWIFGEKKEENNVIEINYNGNKLIFEP
eukprot:495903_1